MNNEITINTEEIRKLPDNSITDPETIRQIALTNDDSLYPKVKMGFEFSGLYPFVIEKLNIQPESYISSKHTELLRKIMYKSNLEHCGSSEDMQNSLEEIHDLITENYPYLQEDDI